VELGQRRLAVDAEDLFHDRTGQAVPSAARPVGQTRGERRQLAVAVGLAQLRRHGAALAVAQLGCARAQHEVREVQVEFVRRHVGAFDHEAHVAQRAGVHDLLEVGAVDRIELAGLGLVDQVEQRREGIAEVEAAPAAVTDVEDPAQLRLDLVRVGEVRIPPVDGMPDRRVEPAFAHGLILSVFKKPARHR